MSKVMVICRGSIGTEEFVETLQKRLGEDFEVFAVYRDYHAEGYAYAVDFIVGDGTCKTSGEDGRSMPIYYDSRALAKKLRKKYFHRNPYGRFDKIRAERIALRIKKLAS